MRPRRGVLFLLFTHSPEPNSVPGIYWWLRHPIFACLGLRPVFAQHTRAEDEALRRWGRGRRTVVEIGVGEGASALALREELSPNGVLYLIDPFHLSTLPWVNAPKRAARAAVAQCRKGTVVWIEEFSSQTACKWETPIDLLFLDGDHSEDAVWRDWENWHRFIIPGGLFVFMTQGCFRADGQVRNTGRSRL